MKAVLRLTESFHSAHACTSRFECASNASLHKHVLAATVFRYCGHVPPCSHGTILSRNQYMNLHTTGALR